MVSDIKPINPINELCKFADDITVEAPGYDEEDTGAEEVENMKLWSNENRMVLNMNKTYEMIVRGRTSIPLPSCIPFIKRKTWLKILGITLEEIPENWDRHFEEILKKASGRMYILRVCKYYGFTTKQLELLFQSLIMSLFTFGIELWGGASYTKYISQIDKFVNRAYRNGYVTEKYNFREIINKRDKRLWKKILDDDHNALRELLPNKLNRTLRQRGHDFELPLVRTERFKKSFVNRCLFNFI